MEKRFALDLRAPRTGVEELNQIKARSKASLGEEMRPSLICYSHHREKRKTHQPMLHSSGHQEKLNIQRRDGDSIKIITIKEGKSMEQKFFHALIEWRELIRFVTSFQIQQNDETTVSLFTEVERDVQD
ncbi:unnamed protein product [Leuciscus chuanchicus]